MWKRYENVNFQLFFSINVVFNFQLKLLADSGLARKNTPTLRFFLTWVLEGQDRAFTRLVRGVMKFEFLKKLNIIN